MIPNQQTIESIDTNIFKNNQQNCNGYNDCTQLTRIMTALSYYNKISSNEADKFIQFCDQYYSTQYLEDYIHFMCVHKNDLNEIQKMQQNSTCLSAKSCSYTHRHYADRTRNEFKTTENVSQHMCVDIFDSMHFYMYHMAECGLRISINNKNDINNIDDVKDMNNESYLQYRDATIAAIQKEIEVKKEKCGLFKRLDSTKNSKFNIMHNNYNTDDKERKQVEENEKSNKIWEYAQNIMNKYFGKKTFTDNMLDNICSVGIRESAVNNLKQYLSVEEYDTDCIEDDIDMYEDIKNCNLLKAANNNKNCVEKIKEFIEMVNISSGAFSGSFSTGFVFWYWPWYKNISDGKIKQKQSNWKVQNDNDFGGHSVRQLFVKNHYNSLKEEVLNSKFITINQFNEKVIKKGNAYIVTEKCKNIRCYYGYDIAYEKDITADVLHFGIKKGAGLKKSHLYALILYCDFSDLCTDFSGTFRRMKWNESVKSVAQRNSKYFHISKNLREVIQYYGIDNYYNIKYKWYTKDDKKKHRNPNGYECGPFYSGLTFVLNIPEFCIRLNGPTSTSIHKEIAIRFATRAGMIIQLNNEGQYSSASREIFFDVSWLSGFAEEDERIFCGGRYKMQLETIIVMETKNNYHEFVAAVYKLDQILSGADYKDIGRITTNEMKIVTWWISYTLGESRNNNKFDKFLINTFSLFAQKKTQIILNLRHLAQVKNKDFIGLIMHSVGQTGYWNYALVNLENEIPKDNQNLFRSCLLRIFGNLKEIIIYSSNSSNSFQSGDLILYSFNILELLSILEEVELPQSFKTIIIKDDHECPWLESVFSAEIKQKFGSKNLKIELKRKQGRNKNEDWMVVTV